MLCRYREVGTRPKWESTLGKFSKKNMRKVDIRITLREGD